MITYGEYLPLILGESAKQELPLYDTYDEKEDPSIANVISIAFRPPQRTIPTSVYLLNNRYETTKKLDFSDTLFSTWMAVEGGLDPIFRGVMVNAAKMVTQDAMASDEVRDKPFVRVNSLASGLDLVASNIQRNRDHGLPRYNAWRKFCGLSQPRNLDELARVLKNQELARKILDLYNTTANIDLWVGAISEPFVKNGRVGPLQACLIGQQFKKLRDGDRYWWQNAGVFTKKQREALSTTSLARVLCDNTGLQDVPINVFKANEYPRDFERCSTLKKLDLSAWAEDKS